MSVRTTWLLGRTNNGAATAIAKSASMVSHLAARTRVWRMIAGTSGRIVAVSDQPALSAPRGPRPSAGRTSMLTMIRAASTTSSTPPTG